ncbi:hypothetical protein [Oryzifoliimicrobium ureilyticus]|uniref:hypothetical protein n=1 Tax=Oryzifoliimicrobium ureilyticus TaxID=3113724 RepID=UPI00307631E3
MRIAACLSGMGRTAAYCKPYLDRFFRGHAVDYFIHAWPNDTDHLALYAPKAVSLREPWDIAQKERAVISAFRQYGFIGRIPMYWGISQAIGLVPEEGYDLIVRLRPDVVPLMRLNASLSDVGEGTVSFAYWMQDPMHRWSPPSDFLRVNDETLAGYHDHLFFGRPAAMRHFERAYDLIEDYCASGLGVRFTPAQFMHYLIAASIPNPRRAPISLHLIDEQHAKSALALYEFRPRSERTRPRDLQRVAAYHPDLAPIFAAERPKMAPTEDWFERSWAGSQGSPNLRGGAKRMAQRIHGGAL